MTCKQVTSSPPPPILGLSHALLGSAASMDSVNSFGRFEDGVDITHLRQDTECHDNDNNPSCPITCLGFDCLALSPEQHEPTIRRPSSGLVVHFKVSKFLIYDRQLSKHNVRMVFKPTPLVLAT